MEKILLVDDDITFTRLIENYLRRKGYQTDVCHNVKDAAALVGRASYALLLLDYRLPDGTGLDVMAAAQKSGHQIPAVIMTSFNDVRTAVKAMRSGAVDYITKPVHQEELLMLVAEAMNNSGKTAQQHTDASLSSFVEGISEPAQKLQHQVKLIAPTDMSVIIHGESGTGKEYIARLIHNLSPRKGKPFVAVDCGTLSAELASSELFGHMKGSFTGALDNKTGRFEEADGGSLFLDEIGNLSYEVQVKLLRALQERAFYPVGGHKVVQSDVRLIVATNEDLKVSVQAGKFREDLYHRLNEFKVNIPPLRKRGDDLHLFVTQFINQANSVLQRNVQKLSGEVTDIFRKYDWPGNIRELKNIIKRLVLLSSGETAVKDDLPEDMLLELQNPSGDPGNDLKLWQEQKEKELIEQTLKEVKYNKQKAARLLNINRSTLYAKMEKYNISGN